MEEFINLKKPSPLSLPKIDLLDQSKEGIDSQKMNEEL